MRHGSRLNGIFALPFTTRVRKDRPRASSAACSWRVITGVSRCIAVLPEGFCSRRRSKPCSTIRGLSREINPARLPMLAYLWTPAPDTMLARVRKLEPGAALVSRGGKVVRHLALLNVPYDGTEPACGIDELSPDACTRVGTAVTRQLVSDVPVGAFLSGGLDSERRGRHDAARASEGAADVFYDRGFLATSTSTELATICHTRGGGAPHRAST